MLLFPYIRNRKIKPIILKEKNFYEKDYNDKKSEYQLNQFNKNWFEIQKNVSYYDQLIQKKVVPKEIKNWNDFNKLPIINRSYIRDNINLFTDTSKKANSWVNTGGSTGTPLNYPKWKSESRYNEASTWYSRTFYNINRSDKMFRLWGHSHALGSGITKYKNIIKLKVGLPLIGYKRFSAYDLSEKALRQAGDEILRFKPKYIIGYSKALNLLAVYNKDRREEFHKLDIKAVIGAAEGFEKNTDKEFISDVFGSEIALQYASMETHFIAHTHPKGNYRVLWKDNLIECVDDQGNPSKTGRVLVTSLYPRAFPLVRYELGDIIMNTNKDGQSVYEFEEVKGRDNDFLKLDEDTIIHSEAISHAVKYSDKITAYQIRYTLNNLYTLYLISNEEITSNDKDEIIKRLSKIDNRLSKIEIKQTMTLKQTIAGKTKWLIEE